MTDDDNCRGARLARAWISLDYRERACTLRPKRIGRNPLKGFAPFTRIREHNRFNPFVYARPFRGKPRFPLFHPFPVCGLPCVFLCLKAPCHDRLNFLRFSFTNGDDEYFSGRVNGLGFKWRDYVWRSFWVIKEYHNYSRVSRNIYIPQVEEREILLKILIFKSAIS